MVIRDEKENHMTEEMEQTHLYQYIGIENDPLYDQVMQMETNQSIYLHGMQMKVTKTNYNMYEVETVEYHECYSNVQSLYENMIVILNAICSNR